MHKTLNIPELLHLILRELDRRNLAKVAQVCQALWAATAPLIWKIIPNLDHLAYLPKIPSETSHLPIPQVNHLFEFSSRTIADRYLTISILALGGSELGSISPVRVLRQDDRHLVGSTSMSNCRHPNVQPFPAIISAPTESPGAAHRHHHRRS